MEKLINYDIDLWFEQDYLDLRDNGDEQLTIGGISWDSLWDIYGIVQGNYGIMMGIIWILMILIHYDIFMGYEWDKNRTGI